jgi:hypothetical protein
MIARAKKKPAAELQAQRRNINVAEPVVTPDIAT